MLLSCIFTLVFSLTDPYASFCEGWYIQSNGCFLLSQSFFKTTILAVDMEALQLTGVYCSWSLGAPMTTWAKIYGSNVSLRSLSWKPISFKPFLVGNHEPQKGRVQVVSPNRASPSLAAELLYVWDDEYKGVIIDP